MGKKKGGNKNKLAKMSEEERARYLQHRADMEEEARRRKQQLIATFMKNKLKREDAFARLNLAKINQEWRTILRNIKCKELKEEVEAVEKTCTECIENKNAVIKRLLCDLDESEDLYSTMLHAHMERVEKIIRIHNDRVNFLMQLYELDKRELIENYEREMDLYKSKKFGLQKDLECVFYGLVEKARTDRLRNDEDHMLKKDELKNSMILKLEMITKEREREMERLWKEFQRVLNLYLRNTEEYRNEYNTLRDQDSSDTKNIQDHYAEVARLSDQIADLRLKLATLKEEHEFNMKQMQKSKAELQLRVQNLKQEMEVGSRLDQEQLKTLAVYSNDAIKHLQGVLKKVKSIFQIATFCKKYETESEDLLPFVQSSLGKAPPRAVPSSSGGSEATSEHGEATSEPDGTVALIDGTMESFKREVFDTAELFENFWMRFNKARIDVACLREEKQQLIERNEQLKGHLKDYLITVNMNSGGPVETHEDLLTKRPTSMKIEKLVRIDEQVIVDDRGLGANRKAVRFRSNGQRRPVTCIEGNLSNAIRNDRLLGVRAKTSDIYSMVQNTA
ncbi:dynein regulatory complex subunit 2 [Anopheles ziemanni]|uniref:dynein regulatory complex subunit 2 n=1 Tax=Anopheles coustani TaxID=139045 RepID=UPI00265B6DBF|nr:dynein regulatory complex subunit 2 [Anopheles coustani]XP_058174127.1 dynein regulatory complex subunit 2 [Anopheles ziemanni]